MEVELTPENARTIRTIKRRFPHLANKTDGEILEEALERLIARKREDEAKRGFVWKTEPTEPKGP